MAISLTLSPIHANAKLLHVDAICIEKSKKKMHVYHKGVIQKSYDVALGFSPKGAKEKEGDGKTPEGEYRICGKNPQSRYHKSLKISYPNAKDCERAKKNGCRLGGNIMIHGVKNGFGFLGGLHTLKNWTLGCVAVTNEEIDEIFAATSVGTVVHIKP